MIDFKQAMVECDMTEEDLAAGRRMTKEYIDSYNLRQARESARITQAALAEAIGVSQARISELESGNLDGVRLGTLKRYVQGVGGTMDVILVLPQGKVRLAW